MIDTPDPYLRAPLFIATMYGFLDIVNLLLSHGSRAMDIQTRAGRTPLSFPEDTKSAKLQSVDRPL
jgi:ankyrin repeat protein